MSSLVTGCASDEFQSPAQQKGQIDFSDKADVVANSERTNLINSPRIHQVLASAKDNKIELNIDTAGEDDANVILGTEIFEIAGKADVVELRSAIKLGDVAVEYAGAVLIAKEVNGKALRVSEFNIDNEHILHGNHLQITKTTSVQAISHCSDDCAKLFIHIQVIQDDKSAAAFYNFEKDKNGKYHLQNTSVGIRYLTIDQVRDLFNN
jgi:predicted lipoprotein with Yx(FWY)xxD motif